jgi:purine-binding chemotaxis protein CheW
VAREQLSPDARTACLVVEVGARACAFPLLHAIETMRPLPVEPLAGMPPFVLGLSIVRGAPMPVVYLGRLLGAGDTNVISRFVTLRLGDRTLALAVSAVSGVRELDLGTLEKLPRILGSESADIIQSIGCLDTELVVILQTMRVLPEPVWDALSVSVATP